MKTFIDSTGKQNAIKITIGACERILAASGVDVLSANPLELARLFDEPITLGKAIVAAAGGKMTADDLDAETFKNAAEAFFAELADFFRLSGRSDLATLLAKMNDRQNEGIKQRAELIATRFGDLSGAPPASSASTPEGSPSGS